MNNYIKERQQLEEIVNSTTHGIGLIAAIVYAIILIVRAEILGNAWHIVTFSMFGLGMIFMYLISTLFHSSKNLRIKSQLNKADHSCIYILIAYRTKDTEVSLQRQSLELYGLGRHFNLLNCIYHSLVCHRVSLRLLKVSCFLVLFNT